jgi:aminopeptidase-like protein
MEVNVDISEMLDRLFPLNRSITGRGLRESLRIIGEQVPIKMIEYPTGMSCFDWEIPKEWNVKEAYLEDQEGQRMVDFADNNLHLLGYSIPFKGKISKEELKKHLYTLKDMPNAIPYVTSFYEERWGFSMQYDIYKKLHDENYYVNIDSTLEQGSLTLGEGYIKGKSNREILLHTYIGHPSMANDQLSGPLTLLLVYKWLLENKDILNYSYRILFCPETIGTIAYLSKNIEMLKENFLAGYVIAFTGDRGSITYKKSKTGASLSNRAAENVLETGKREFRIKNYTPYGADERQFNSPGINLEMGAIMRSGPGEYKEYHTSLDDKAFILEESIRDSANFVIETIKNIEINCSLSPIHLMCEPKLDKRGLYTTLGKNGEDKTLGRQILAIWGLSDISSDLIEVAQNLNVPAYSLKSALEEGIKSEIITVDTDIY